ncbi:MAG: preprotein translocase subunit SecG [Pseudomonadota bacterium]
METVLIVIHLMVVVALVAVVLLQRSEGGALGIGGGGGGGGGNFMTARGAANALTRTTAILAFTFFVTSIGLGIISGIERGSVLDNLPIQNQEDGGSSILDQLGGSESLDLGTDQAPSEPSVPTTE